MTPLSTGKAVSSRTFDARMMKDALSKMPSSQRSMIYSLIESIDERTDMGYYAAMDFVASMGLFMTKHLPSSTNST